MRGGAMQQAFMGTRMAAEGNVASFFSLARVIRSVATATSGLTAALGIIGMLLAVASVLWQQYKSRQDEAAKSAQEATEKLVAAQQHLHDVIAATKAPNYDPQVKGLQAIAAAYADAEEAAKNYKDAQDQVAAAQTATKVAGISETAQRAIGAAAGDENKQAEIALNAKRAAAGVNYEAEYANIERAAKTQEEHLARLKETLNALAIQDIEGMFSTPLKRAEESITRIRNEQVKMTKSGGEVSQESVEKLSGAIADRDKLKAESEKAQAQREKQIRDTRAGIVGAEQSLAATPAKKKQLAAEFSATEAADFAAEATRVATQDKLRAEKDILKAKEESRKQAEAETEAVKASGENRADQLEDEIAITKIEQERAENEAIRLRARILSPAAGRAQDKEEREAKKEADRIEKRIKFAEDQQRRGGRGKWIEEALSLKGAREEAAAKQGELNQLEQQRTVAAVETAQTLKSIQTALLANLQFGGAG